MHHVDTTLLDAICSPMLPTYAALWQFLLPVNIRPSCGASWWTTRQRHAGPHITVSSLCVHAAA
eukprot:35068-Eustigmatos_ZCMA.PRE.1